MKKIVTLSALFLGVLFLAGCGQQPVSQTRPITSAPVAQTPTQPIATQQPVTPSTNITGWQTYKNEKYGFKFQFPQKSGEYVFENNPSQKGGDFGCHSMDNKGNCLNPDGSTFTFGGKCSAGGCDPFLIVDAYDDINNKTAYESVLRDCNNVAKDTIIGGTSAKFCNATEKTLIYYVTNGKNNFRISFYESQNPDTNKIITTLKFTK